MKAKEEENEETPAEETSENAYNKENDTPCDILALAAQLKKMQQKRKWQEHSNENKYNGSCEPQRMENLTVRRYSKMEKTIIPLVSIPEIVVSMQTRGVQEVSSQK
jgi:hypothetical protein